MPIFQIETMQRVSCLRMRRSKGSILLLPVQCVLNDIKKAYDSVNREFILHMMHQMNFPCKVITMVKEMINSPSFSILYKGIPKGHFQSRNEIRQGDPLSPYLFTIIMECFAILMDLKVNSGKLNPYTM